MLSNSCHFLSFSFAWSRHHTCLQCIDVSPYSHHIYDKVHEKLLSLRSRSICKCWRASERAKKRESFTWMAVYFLHYCLCVTESEKSSRIWKKNVSKWQKISEHCFTDQRTHSIHTSILIACHNSASANQHFNTPIKCSSHRELIWEHYTFFFVRTFVWFACGENSIVELLYFGCACAFHRVAVLFWLI